MENKGQLQDSDGDPCRQILYYSKGAALNLFMGVDSRITYAIDIPSLDPNVPDEILGILMTPTGEAALRSNPVPINAKHHVEHFYMPHTQNIDATNVQNYDWIIYEDFVRNVDLYYHSGSGGLKFSFVCKPGFIPADLQLMFEGQDSLKLDIAGELKMWSSGRYIKLKEAAAFQIDAFNTVQQLGWNASYQPQGETGVVTFQFANYDTTRDLILQSGPLPISSNSTIEDGLCWSTYLGGSYVDQAVTSTVDAYGHYYVTGYTRSAYSTFPNGPGLISNNAPGLSRVFTTAFGPNHAIYWTAYLSALGDIEVTSIAAHLSSTGDVEVYIGGVSESSGLYLETKQGVYYDGIAESANGFLAQYDEDGVIQWSTYYGGSSTRTNGLAFNSQNRLLICGSDAAGAIPQPFTQPPGALAQPYAGGHDGFLALLDAMDYPYWTTYLGGSSSDYSHAIVTTVNSIKVVGSSSSVDFLPIQSAGGTNALNESQNAGGLDLSITEFSNSGVVNWSSLYGSAGDQYIEIINPLTIDNAGNLFIIFKTTPNTLEVVPGVGWYQIGSNWNGLLEISADRSVTWATHIGGPSNLMVPRCIAADEQGNVFVAGMVQPFLGQVGLPETVELEGAYFQGSVNSLDTEPERGHDGFIIGFTPDHYLILATYFVGDEFEFPIFDNTYIETITTMVSTTDYLYIAGLTSKGATPIDSYFPQFDPGIPAFFQEHFNSQVPNGEDAFVTALCRSSFTGVTTRPTIGSGIRIIHSGSDEFIIQGLASGIYALTVYDEAGRVVLGRTIGNHSNELMFGVGSISNGMYVLEIRSLQEDSKSSKLKFVVSQ